MPRSDIPCPSGIDILSGELVHATEADLWPVAPTDSDRIARRGVGRRGLLREVLGYAGKFKF